MGAVVMAVIVMRFYGFDSDGCVSMGAIVMGVFLWVR